MSYSSGTPLLLKQTSNGQRTSSLRLLMASHLTRLVARYTHTELLRDITLCRLFHSSRFKISVEYCSRNSKTSIQILASVNSAGKYIYISVYVTHHMLKSSDDSLTRGPNGTFSDDALAKVLHDATENPAGAYGARNTPDVLRVIEVMGMQQARQWGVCSMNEFRKSLGLKRASCRLRNLCVCLPSSVQNSLLSKNGIPIPT